MLPLFPTARKVSGWDATGEGLRRRFHHPSGWRIEHCGHPTANHPWDVWSPQGRRLRTEAGLAWSHLATAKEAVEAILCGEATTRKDEKGRLIFSPPPRPTTSAGKTAGVGEP